MARIITTQINAPQGLRKDYIAMVRNTSVLNPFEGLSQVAGGIKDALRTAREIGDYEDAKAREIGDYEYNGGRRKIEDAQKDLAFDNAQSDRREAALERNKRAEEIAEYLQQVSDSGDAEEIARINDPRFVAALNEYRISGSSAPLMNYNNQVANEAAMKAAKVAEASEAEEQKKVAELRKEIAAVKLPLTEKQWTELENREEKIDELETLRARAIELNEMELVAKIDASLTEAYKGGERKDVRDNAARAKEASSEAAKTAAGAFF